MQMACRNENAVVGRLGRQIDWTVRQVCQALLVWSLYGVCLLRH